MQEIIDAKDIDCENAELVVPFPFSLVKKAMLSSIFLASGSLYLLLKQDTSINLRIAAGVMLLLMLPLLSKWMFKIVNYWKTNRLHPAVAITKEGFVFNVVSLTGDKYRRVAWEKICKAKARNKKQFMAKFCLMELYLYASDEIKDDNALKRISFVAGEVYYKDILIKALQQYVRVDET